LAPLFESRASYSEQTDEQNGSGEGNDESVISRDAATREKRRGLPRAGTEVSRDARLFELFRISEATLGCGSWLADLRDGSILWSPELFTLCGIEPRPETLDLLWECVHPEDRNALTAAILAACGNDREFCCETRLLRPDGSVLWVQHRGRVARSLDGRPARMIGTLLDIGTRKLAERELFVASKFDSLTGLPNRSFAVETIENEIERARRARDVLAVLVVDLDRFKIVNDTLGDTVGDRFLIEICRRLREVGPHSDMLARVGGDKFCIVATGIGSPSDAAERATAIVDAFAAPFEFDGRELAASASVGNALFPGDGDEADGLFRNADIAMYRAKDSGRGRFAFFASAMQERALDRIALESEMRGALQRDEYVVQYQPIVGHDGSVTTLEALVRWRHPKRGLLAPGVFVEASENNGTIHGLGAFVLRRALADLQRWRELGIALPRMAINVSVRQDLDPNFVEAVAIALAEFDVEPDLIEFEITESVFIHDVERARRAIEALRNLGAQISLDDFGTGYSALSYLREFRFDAIKIDRAFVRDLPDRVHVAIFSAIVALAKSLGVRTIAEGVETPEQAALVRQLGCDDVQGFLFSRPCDASEVAAMLGPNCFAPVWETIG
jgi:diguanylate cyclase (GGDEF)-like protein/PAS domain S-box-containing protein